MGGCFGIVARWVCRLLAGEGGCVLKQRVRDEGGLCVCVFAGNGGFEVLGMRRWDMRKSS